MCRRAFAIATLLLLVLISGCREPVELAGIGRVAVLIPDNHTECPELSDDIKRELLSQLARKFRVEVVDGTAVEAILPRNGIDASFAEPGLAAELGAQYGVDAFIVGAVTDYREDHREQLSIGWSSAEGFEAGGKVDLVVTVAFHLRLIRAADGTPLVYRQLAESAHEVLSFGLTNPYISFALSVQPVFPQLRREAVRGAVRKMLRELARSSPPAVR